MFPEQQMNRQVIKTLYNLDKPFSQIFQIPNAKMQPLLHQKNLAQMAGISHIATIRFQ